MTEKCSYCDSHLEALKIQGEYSDRLKAELKEARDEEWAIVRGIMDALGLENADEIGPGYDPRAEIASLLREWKSAERESQSG